MSLILYKLIASLLIFAISVGAVIYPLKVRAHPTHHFFLELADAFASGIFLGAALFHMLPDSIAGFSQIPGMQNYPLAELFCAGGFMLLLFFERLSTNSSDHHDTTSISYVIAIIIIIHSLIEGTVLGVNTSYATALIIFLAIVAHKSSESFALAVILNQSRLTYRHILVLVGIFSLMTPIGIGFGTTMSLFLHNKMVALLTAGFNAFAAGTFLYMSTLHHINHHKRSHQGEGLIEFFSLLSGLIVMAVLAIWS